MYHFVLYFILCYSIICCYLVLYIVRFCVLYVYIYIHTCVYHVYIYIYTLYLYRNKSVIPSLVRPPVEGIHMYLLSACILLVMRYVIYVSVSERIKPYYRLYIKYQYVPHKAVAEVSKIGNL